MISGKGFSELCKWVFDPRYPERPRFSYSQAAAGDWVFVNGDYLAQFRSQIPLFAPKQFTVVVHNSDRSFGLVELGMLLPVSKHIYAVNTTVQHPKLTTIPLGFSDSQLSFLKTFQPTDGPRDIEVYLNFTLRTKVPARVSCLAAMQNDPRVTLKTNRSVSEYYEDLCRSKFVLCPDGTGIDTHRVYEALFCGATPVVLRNPLSDFYKGLPVCIVDRWTDPMSVPNENAFSVDTSTYIQNP